MTIFRRSWIWLGIISLVLTTVAQAQSDGSADRFGSANRINFESSPLWKSMGSQSAAKKPGLFQRASASTQSFMASTRRMLSGSKSTRRPTQATASRRAKKSSGLGSLFRPAQKEAPRTVDEWLSLQRPQAL